jgi:hypothetical protein
MEPILLTNAGFFRPIFPVNMPFLPHIQALQENLGCWNLYQLSLALLKGRDIIFLESSSSLYDSFIVER